MAAAAAAAALFLAVPAEKALAQERGSGVTMAGRNNDRNRDRQFRRGGPDRNRSYGQRFERRLPSRFDSRVFVRPYRTVRVFVAFPYPHYVLRRVYNNPAVVLGPNCDRY